MNTIQKIACAAFLSLAAVPANAQNAAAPNIDFEALLSSCSSDSSGCAAILQQALGQITAVQAQLPAAVVDNLLGSLATVAVSAATETPGISQSMGSIVETIAETVSEDRRDSLQQVAQNVSNGNSGGVDLDAVAGSPG